MENMLVQHTLPPVYDGQSKILILGTMPSPKSRELGFYYGHPQNRFWKVLGAVLDAPVPATVPEKKEWLLREHIALWDVLAQCRITGASDSSIRDAKPNEISHILDAADIHAVFTTGKTAYTLYEKLCLPVTGRPARLLPSPSPANCAMSFAKMVEEYSAVKAFL